MFLEFRPEPLRGIDRAEKATVGQSSASGGVPFSHLQDDLLRRTASTLISNCHRPLLVALPELDVAAYRSSRGHHGDFGLREVPETPGESASTKSAA
jgi:hypothetical protein